MSGRTFSHAAPPPMISLTNEHTRRRTYQGGGVYRVGMGAVGPGAALKANLIVEFFFRIIPLKIWLTEI